jgi:hypothetical protein
MTQGTGLMNSVPALSNSELSNPNSAWIPRFVTQWVSQLSTTVTKYLR